MRDDPLVRLELDLTPEEAQDVLNALAPSTPTRGAVRLYEHLNKALHPMPVWVDDPDEGWGPGGGQGMPDGTPRRG